MRDATDAELLDASIALRRLEKGETVVLTPEQVFTLRNWLDRNGDVAPKDEIVRHFRSLLCSYEHLRIDRIIENL